MLQKLRWHFRRFAVKDTVRLVEVRAVSFIHALQDCHECSWYIVRNIVVEYIYNGSSFHSDEFV